MAKIISVLQPDSGQFLFWQDRDNTCESKALGISNVYQEVLVADECSVLDNLFLGADSLFERLNHATTLRKIKADFVELLGFELDPESIVGDLPLSLNSGSQLRGACLQIRASSFLTRVPALD